MSSNDWDCDTILAEHEDLYSEPDRSLEELLIESLKRLGIEVDVNSLKRG